MGQQDILYANHSELGKRSFAYIASWQDANLHVLIVIVELGAGGRRGKVYPYDGACFFYIPFLYLRFASLAHSIMEMG